MSTFGNSNIESFKTNTRNVIVAGKFTLSEDGDVTKITAVLKFVSGSHDAADLKTKCGIYDSSFNFLGATNETTWTALSYPSTSDTWYDFTFASPLSLTAGDYLLVVWSNQSGASTPNAFQTSLATSGGQNGYLKTFTYNGFQDPLSGYTTLTNAKHSIYATYTPTGGTNIQINIGDAWKSVEGMQINIGDTWKEVTGAQVNIGDAWKTIF